MFRLAKLLTCHNETTSFMSVTPGVRAIPTVSQQWQLKQMTDWTLTVDDINPALPEGP